MEIERVPEDELQFLVEVQADWREQKAAEYSDDDRNLRAAAALRDLAKWISENGNAPEVVRLEAARDRLDADPDVSDSFAPTVEQRLGRYGFHRGEPEPPAEFLRKLTADIEESVLAVL